MKQEKYSNNPPGGGDQKSLVNIKDASCSLMMVSSTEEWGKLTSPGLMFCQTSTREVPQTEPINNSVNKGNTRIINVGDTILSDAAEAGIDEIFRLLDNQSTCNTFINKKYLSNIRDVTNGKYLRFHCNTGVTHTKKIGDIPGYSYPV